MYKMLWQEQLQNGEYRNKIGCHMLYTSFDIRSDKIYNLDEILEKIESKYNKELCFLNSQYVLSI